MKKYIFSSVLFACLALLINAQNRQLEYLGGAMSWLPRIEKVPGRSFQDINGVTVDPIKHMAGKGFKVIRVFVSSDMPTTSPAGFPDNSGDVLGREANFMLDNGGFNEQVNLALRAKAAGMKIILTLHMGQGYGPNSWGEYIPKAWLNLTYTQMLTQLDTETRRMLAPFMNAGIQPDIIIVENEADTGMLYQYQDANGNMAIRNNPATDVFSNVATGVNTIWPKCAGYFKRVILTAKAVIAAKGMDNAYTRFAVHTTTNPYRIRTTYDLIFNQPALNETNYVVNGVNKGVVSIIPSDIRNTKLQDLVDIMGATVGPAQPASGSSADLAASLAQFNSDWGYVGSKITSFGKWTSGPYTGQYKKQGLVVEFTIGGVTEDVRVAAVTEFLNEVCNNYPWIIGAMWWEPEYANNNWYAGTAVLYKANGLVFKELPTLAVWGSYSTTAPIANGTYVLFNRNSGKCLEVGGNSTANGANVQQWGYVGSASQKWTLTNLGGCQYGFINVNSGICMEVGGNNTSNGANVQQWQYVGSASQRWLITPTSGGYYKLIGVGGGKALEVASGSFSDGANVAVWAYYGGNHQQWAINQLKSASATKAIEETAVGDNPGNVHIYPNPLVGQQLTIEGLSENSSISIYSLNGMSLFSQKTEGKQVVIPMEKFQPGAYIVKVTTPTGVIVEKIIKQ